MLHKLTIDSKIMIIRHVIQFFFFQFFSFYHPKYEIKKEYIIIII